MSVEIIQPRGCKNCKFSKRDDKILLCCFNPPAAYPVAVGHDQVRFISQFPPVSPDTVCGQYVHGVIHAQCS